MKSIIFVCLGNICRSPLAKGVAENYIKNNNLNLLVDSAGTSKEHQGEIPCENSIKVARDNNIDISKYRAKQFLKSDIDKFDLVVALDSNNYYNLKNMGCKNLVKLGDFGFGGKDVPDPYYFNGFDGFIEVFNMVEKSVKNLLLSLENK
ncbi:low molecular weight protein-tyrosine-phosphatase [Aliarcobacter cibarius]|jgi:protein-tyrosine phosphatase|uniref:protein-tyrosine-phosphatase n=1 Tax=Aliarcobacter cibarius TaxID=255507 RepID=A0A5J6RG14_9BACT|nr:low molecular weight protein-tyrosine-phosphatase [Aliarcobacter cibarius]QEZ88844.1 low molecular weight protein-tyrosine-phosphatase [Aliarcobacter cibarius]QKJ26883.1 low molecular weight protein-tyrosine-phosphatase [Aliarcobacter cibarius]TLS96024.1 low molecular weight phosphotyrosine protein phosphatase [Aliarcobacter cibarius]TLS96641.1 low molecular weight phosphotyrosine protein phosphatase [Aliarcobacter cibarius]TLT03090.1 low molecular weight phosphotyrosine protein phosphatase